MGTVARRRTGVLLAALACAGCGGGSSVPGMAKQPVHPVGGSVTYRGKPVAGVRVSLVSAQQFDGRRFSSEPLTDAGGSFVCGTYAAADGLPPGAYEVRLSWPDRPNDDQRETERDRLGGRYNQSAKPAFVFEVKPGDNTAGPYNLQ